MLSNISFSKENIKGHAASTAVGLAIFASSLINVAATALSEHGIPSTKEEAIAAVAPAVAEFIGATVVSAILAFFGVKR